MVEQRTENPRVPSSILGLGTISLWCRSGGMADAAVSKTVRVTSVSVRVRPSADKKEARFLYVNRMPSCVVVAQGTLDPLAQVRILARQPLRTVTGTLSFRVD